MLKDGVLKLLTIISWLCNVNFRQLGFTQTLELSAAVIISVFVDFTGSAIFYTKNGSEPVDYTTKLCYL